MNTKRITLAAAVSLVLMFTALAPAAEPEYRAICDYAGEQSFPAVSGNYVVWQDYRSGKYGIYRNDPTDDSNTIGILIKSHTTYNLINPAISGNIVVWQDNRYSTRPDVYYCILPSSSAIALINTSDQQECPVISDTNMVVWQEFISTTDKNIYYCLFPSGTRTPVCDLTGSVQENPAVSGNMAVWQDTRNTTTGVDIYRYNLSTYQEFEVCRNSGDQKNPAISGNWIVWQDNRNGDFDIYGKNTSTGEEREICRYAVRDQVNPAVSGDLVVWEDYRHGTTGTNNADIYGYRFSTNEIFAVCTNSSHQKNPAIDGNFVVWQDYRLDGSGDIYGAHIPNPAPKPVITVLDPNGGESLPAGSKHWIRWNTKGSIGYVRIEDSNDNGLTFSIVDANVANNSDSNSEYLWTLPTDANSDQCRIKISDKSDPDVNDISDNVFTIFICDPALKADISGDCKVDFVDFALLSGQWLDCGNLRDPAWCP